MSSGLKTDFNIQQLRNRLLPKQDEYIEEGYEAVAFHTSSILVCANQAAVDMFGYTLEELQGMNAWHFFHPGSAQVIMKHLLEKSTEPYQVVAVKKDKTEFNVEIKGLDFEVDGEYVRVVLLKKL